MTYPHYVSENEIELNKLISLKLESKQCNIYINKELFRNCKILILNIPIDDVAKFDDITSIDHLKETMSSKGIKYESHYQKRNEDLITPEEEFQAHASNLMAWIENEYNTAIIDSRLAFPLLKELIRHEDPLALKVYKDEFMKRFEEGIFSTQIFLLEQNKELLTKFTFEELEVLEECISKQINNNKVYDESQEFNHSIEFEFEKVLWVKICNYLFPNSMNKILNPREVDKLNGLIKTGSKMVVNSLFRRDLFFKLSIYDLKKDHEFYSNKLSKYNKEKLDRFIEKKSTTKRTLFLDNQLYEKAFDDSTMIFKQNINEIFARLFEQVNGRMIHSITHIISSSQTCDICKSHYYTKKNPNKANFQITFTIMKHYDLKFYSIYCCERCLLKRFEDIAEGFERIKKKIYKIVQ